MPDYLYLNEKDDALRVVDYETGKIHTSWVVFGCQLPLKVSDEDRNRQYICSFEHIPENYPGTDLLIEPFSEEIVDNIVKNVLEQWSVDSVRLPSEDSEFGKMLRRKLDPETLETLTSIECGAAPC